MTDVEQNELKPYDRGMILASGGQILQS